MNTRSIRFQLTIWYASALLLFLTLLLPLFYYLTRQALFSQTDQTLIDHGRPILDLVSSATCCFNADQVAHHQQLIKALSNMPGMVIILLSSEGEVLSSSLETLEFHGTVATLFDQYQYALQPQLANQILSGSQVRFWIVPIVQEGELQSMLLVGHPIDNIQHSLTILSLTLGAVFVIVLIPTVLGGYVLARRAILPLETMARQMERINTNHLNLRIKMPNTGDEIQYLTRSFNNLLDRLTTAFGRERQLLGDLAHELKTPLAILKSTADLALSKKRSFSEYRTALEEVVTDADHLASTLEQILDLAWSEAEVANDEIQNIDLSLLMINLKSMVEKLAATKQIRLNFSIAPQVTILGKIDRLQRAILNIVDNAIKYTDKGKVVSVRLRPQGTEAVLSISDTGIGIASKDIPHIFDRFYRGSRVSANRGTGLGLAIAQAIIQAHKGSISIRSSVGKGTIVTMRFPLAPQSI